MYEALFYMCFKKKFQMWATLFNQQGWKVAKDQSEQLLDFIGVLSLTQIM